MTRRVLALRRPATSEVDLAGFPSRSFDRGSWWYRQHEDRAAADRGVWYFSSRPDGGVSDGRFDLLFPLGTCYLSSTVRGAINERIGLEYTARGWVDADLVAGRVVSRLALPNDAKAADTTAEEATRFRATNEIATTDDYEVTQAWADALAGSGFDGVFTLLRFTPGDTRGLAVFGGAGVPGPTPAGDRDAMTVRAIVEAYGIEVIEAPSSHEVTIVGIQIP